MQKKGHVRISHTFAILHLSRCAYEEIKQKLMEAGYQEQFHENDESEDDPLIDMHGIAVVPETEGGEE